MAEVTILADEKGTAVQPPTEPLQVADIPATPEPAMAGSVRPDEHVKK